GQQRLAQLRFVAANRLQDRRRRHVRRFTPRVERQTRNAPDREQKISECANRYRCTGGQSRGGQNRHDSTRAAPGESQPRYRWRKPPRPKDNRYRIPRASASLLPFQEPDITLTSRVIKTQAGHSLFSAFST